MAAENTNQVALEKDEKYWLDDCVMVFRVDNTLFRLPRSALTLGSVGWGNILSCPPRPDSDGTEVHPIDLTGIVTKFQFKGMLEWLYKQPWDFPGEFDNNEELLIGVLKMSDQWLVPRMKEYVVKKLSTKGLHPARLIELSRLYKVPEWVADPLESLILYYPLRILSDNDCNRIGFETFTVISKAKAEIEKEKKTIALVPGLDVDPQEGCTRQNHSQCLRLWSAYWRREVSDVILAPDHVGSLAHIETRVFTYSQHDPRLNVACKEAFFKVIRDSEVFKNERRILNAAYRKTRSFFILPPVDSEAAGAENAMDTA
ncbi:hypothetical protein C8J56DRAFT_1156545 [Mycena floridula]|nr:hypothetical protein C8J56DRAFT_1156545 [Mycena floridula]